MKVNMFAASLATIFTMLAFPSTMIVGAFFRDSLGASNTQIGWLAGISMLSYAAGLFSSYVFDRVVSRKRLWIPAALFMRMSGFVLAGLTIYAAHGGSKQFVIYATMVMIGLSYPAAYLMSPGWYGWFADLFPEKTRGHFIGRRYAFVCLVSLPVYLGAMILVTQVGKTSSTSLFYAMAGVFAFAGVLGVVETLLYDLMPEPRRTLPAEKVTLSKSLKNALTPLTDSRYRGFLLAMIAVNFAMCIRTPFFGPFFRMTLKMPYYWLAIVNCVAFIAAMVTSKQWGFLADRFGARPVMAVSMLWGTFLLAYLFASQDNYAYIVPAVNFICGVFSAGFVITSFHMNLTQAPPGKREACAGMWFVAVGLAGYLGAVLGGHLADWFEKDVLVTPIKFWGVGEIGYMQAVILVSVGLQMVVALPFVLRIRERKHRPVTPLLSMLFGGNIFRLATNVGIIGGPYAPEKKVEALRTMKSRRDAIAMEEIVNSLEDPHREVRAEAALALGRLENPVAVETLIRLLKDRHGGVRQEAAEALGMIKDKRAVEPLLEVLNDPSKEVSDAAARALDRIGHKAGRDVPAGVSREPVDHVAAERKVRALRKFKSSRDSVAVKKIIANLDDPDREVRAEATLALGRVGNPVAVETLIRLLEDKDSGVRREAAKALGMIKDRRAVEPLLDVLQQESEEIQEAVVEALGEIGGPASKSVLTDLLKSDRRIDRVVATSAEAVSKFGDLAAVAEIFPLMHKTSNAVLRSQLAIAAGNLLGRRGQFYEIFSKARTGDHAVWGRLIRQAAKNIRQWAEDARRQQGPAQLDVAEKRRQMSRTLSAVARDVEDERWATAIRSLRGVIGELERFVLGEEPRSASVDVAFLAYPRYGVGLWFATAVEHRLDEGKLDEHMMMIDCLLLLYFLSCLEPGEGQT